MWAGKGRLTAYELGGVKGDAGVAGAAADVVAAAAVVGESKMPTTPVATVVPSFEISTARISALSSMRRLPIRPARHA
jgi:hypothetical protein